MALKDAPRCQAHTTKGAPCRNPAIRGLKVCRSHGGNTRNAREAARRNILELVDPAVLRLAEALNIEAATANDWAVVMRAVKEVLDRAGVAEPKKLEITHITEDVLQEEYERLLAEMAELDG